MGQTPACGGNRNPSPQIPRAQGSLHTLQSALEMDWGHEMRWNLHLDDEGCMLVLKTSGTHYQGPRKLN